MKVIREESWLRPLGEDVAGPLRPLERAATQSLLDQGVEQQAIELHRRARLRYAGSDTTLELPLGTAEQMRSAFENLHRARFGYVDEQAEVIVDALVVEGVGKSGPALASAPAAAAGAEEISGPAVITEATSTTVIEPGDQATSDADGNIVVRIGARRDA